MWGMVQLLKNKTPQRRELLCGLKKKKSKLICKVYPTRDEMGQEAAKEIAEKIRELLAEQEKINMVFASAPSQNDVLKHLLAENVECSRINAFHMDE